MVKKVETMNISKFNKERRTTAVLRNWGLGV